MQVGQKVKSCFGHEGTIVATSQPENRVQVQWQFEQGLEFCVWYKVGSQDWKRLILTYEPYWQVG